MFDQHTNMSDLPLLALVGVIIGMGKLLTSPERLSVRTVTGRALTSAGLGCTAGALLTWFPDLPPMALYGAAAGLASLGTSVIENIAARYLGASK